MKTIKVSEATGPALDWLVAKCEDEGFCISRPDLLALGVVKPRPYSIDWSQGGLLIDREKINLEWWFTDQTWHSCINERLQYDEHGEFIDGSDFHLNGPTPLIAAMRAYVTSKLGNTAEVPEELA